MAVMLDVAVRPAADGQWGGVVVRHQLPS